MKKVKEILEEQNNDELEEEVMEALGENKEEKLVRYENKARDIAVEDINDFKQKIEIEREKRKLLAEYIKENLREGIDYYTITFKDGKVSKPTLSKAGSEKFLSLFNFKIKFSKDEETWEMLGRVPGVVCYKCEVYTRLGELMGEGRGARNIRQDNGDVNKSIKMAEKAAQIDAVLRISGLSDYFTQDFDNFENIEEQQIEQKKQIAILLKKLDVDINSLDAEGWKNIIKGLTNLALEPENYSEIISKLKTKVKEYELARDNKEVIDVAL